MLLALAMAGAVTLAPAAPTAAAPEVRCGGERATIVGTDGRDRLTGTLGRDVIAGLRGNDRISGLAGNDVLCGGRGSDELFGDAGHDRLYGGLDQVEQGGETPYHRGDWLVGGPGDDLLDAGYDPRPPTGGGDRISWATSAHAVHVDLAAGTARGQGRDRVRLVEGEAFLSEHADTFAGTEGTDQVHGLAGPDEVEMRGGHDVVWLDDVEEVSDDVAQGGDGRDSIFSMGGSDVVRGGGGRDGLFLVGDQQLVRAWGGEGNDLIEAVIPVSGDHVMAAGPGDDDRLRLQVLSDEPQSHSIDLISGSLLLGPEELASRATRIEDAELYDGMFTIRGTDGPNRVLVNLVSSFRGMGGNDGFGGSEGDDTFDGGPGEDTYLADSGGTNTCIDVEHDPLAVCAGP